MKTNLITNTVRVDFVVGSPTDVATGKATHSTIQSAIDAAINGQRIFVLAGTYAEVLTVGKRLTIFGMGYDSYVNGNITFTATTSNFSRVEKMRFGQNITLNGSYIFFMDNYRASAFTLSDTGTSNAIFGIDY